MKALTPSTLTAAYRNWLLGEAKREVDDGCQRILSVPNETTVLYGEAMREWSTTRQLELMEEAIALLFRPPGTDAPPNYRECLPLILSWRPSAQLAELRRRARDGEFKVDKRRVRHEVAKRLTPMLGSPPLSIGGVVRYVTRLSKVTAFTDVDFSPRAPATLAYEQIIVEGAAEPGVGYFDSSVLLTRISLLNLLGSASTCWSFISDNDVPSVADALATLCMHWIEAMPDLVKQAHAT